MAKADGGHYLELHSDWHNLTIQLEISHAMRKVRMDDLGFVPAEFALCD